MPSPHHNANRKFNMNGSGVLFQHFGAIPSSAYEVTEFSSPLERAVFDNDITTCKELIKEGYGVSVRLKIGQMTCMEYAAMMGHVDILRLLVEESENAQILRDYFSLNDVVEMAYMISKRKDIFFDRDALTEANRYEAALFTAIAFNQKECVQLMLNYLNPQAIARKHCFMVNDNENKEMYSALELATAKGHNECFETLINYMNRQGGKRGSQGHVAS